MAKQSVCAIHKFVERDIDMLLAEELPVNGAFAEWVMARAGVEAELRFLTAETRVSIVEDGREADVVASFRTSAGGLHRLFVENKLDAILKPDQLERYTRRAEAEERRGSIVGWSVIFFAPAHYGLDSPPEGVVQVSFAEEAPALRARPEWLRSDYRADLLERAAP